MLNDGRTIKKHKKNGGWWGISDGGCAVTAVALFGGAVTLGSGAGFGLVALLTTFV